MLSFFGKFMNSSIFWFRNNLDVGGARLCYLSLVNSFKVFLDSAIRPSLVSTAPTRHDNDCLEN